MVVQLSTAWD